MIIIPFSTPRAIAHGLVMSLTPEQLEKLIASAEAWFTQSNVELAS